MSTIRPSVVAAAALAAIVAGCATTQPPPPPEQARSVAFSAADFAWSQTQGKNAVQGRIAYKDWTCGGGAVGLTPDTPYSRSRVARLYGSTESAVLPVSEVRSRQVSEAGDDYSTFVRTTRCDDGGAYRFDGLPEGSWFLIGRARPEGGGDGVALMKRVTTRGGRVVAASLP